MTAPTARPRPAVDVMAVLAAVQEQLEDLAATVASQQTAIEQLAATVRRLGRERR